MSALHCWVSFSCFVQAYYDMLNGASGYKWNEKWSSGKHGMHSLHYRYQHNAICVTSTLLTKNGNETRDWGRLVLICFCICRVFLRTNTQASGTLYKIVNSRYCTPVFLSYLLRCFCMSFNYGCVLWNLNNPFIKCLDVFMNNILRRVWPLPFVTHSCYLRVLQYLQYLL